MTVKMANCMFCEVSQIRKREVVRAVVPLDVFSLARCLGFPGEPPSETHSSPPGILPPKEGFFIQWVGGKTFKRPISKNVYLPLI